MSDNTGTGSANRRKKLLVEIKPQWALAARTVLYGVVFMLTSSLTAGVYHYLTGFFTSSEGLVPWLLSNLMACAITLLVLLPALIYDSLKLSNRIAGPIHRLHRTIAGINRGEDVQPLKFRKDDFWQDIPDEFNALIARLKEAEKSRQPEEPLPV